MATVPESLRDASASEVVNYMQSRMRVARRRHRARESAVFFGIVWKNRRKGDALKRGRLEFTSRELSVNRTFRETFRSAHDFRRNLKLSPERELETLTILGGPGYLIHIVESTPYVVLNLIPRNERFFLITY